MARVSILGGSRIEQYNSPNAGGTMSGHRGVVLHIAEGTYRGTIAWQLNPDQRYSSGQSVTTCSTWIVGKEQGEWAQMVDSGRIAWCQRDGSRTWLSIELAGYAPNPPTAWQIEACAQLLAWAHQTHGIPVAIADHPGERGLGHHSMDREWLGEEWGHDSCPGSGVIKAKGAIVARAKAILAGEGAFLMALTDAEQSELLKRLRAIDARVGALTALTPTVTTTWAADSDAVEQVAASQALTAIRDRPPAVIDYSALAEEIVARLPETALTRETVRAAAQEAVEGVLRDGVGAAAPTQG
jgi:hypothetical protein